MLQQTANDLDPLALTHGQRVDVAVGIQRQAVILRHVDDPRAQRLEIQCIVQTRSIQGRFFTQSDMVSLVQTGHHDAV